MVAHIAHGRISEELVAARHPYRNRDHGGASEQSERQHKSRSDLCDSSSHHSRARSHPISCQLDAKTSGELRVCPWVWSCGGPVPTKPTPRRVVLGVDKRTSRVAFTPTVRRGTKVVARCRHVSATVIMMSGGACGRSGESYAGHRSPAKYRFTGLVSICNGTYQVTATCSQ